MPEVPRCLNRRYKALDELIAELTASQNCQKPHEVNIGDGNYDPGIKLMCDFWNILKEDPHCNLTQVVKQRMGLSSSSCVVKQQRVVCYMANSCLKEDSECNKGIMKKDMNRCLKEDSECNKSTRKGKDNGNKTDRYFSGYTWARPKSTVSNAQENYTCPNCTSQWQRDEYTCPNCTRQGNASNCCEQNATYITKNLLPLSKVLNNLKEAASYDKHCYNCLNELMNTQKELQAQIVYLENREKEGVGLMKEADCMWSSMEDSYKKIVAGSLEKKEELLEQLKEAEKSNTKWRKEKKDLEGQIAQIAKCHLQITERIAQKTNDIKAIKIEIEDYQKRIEENKTEAAGADKTLSTKKRVFEKKIVTINEQIKSLKDKLKKEQNLIKTKEIEGDKYVKEARNDLQKMCKALLHKRLENEELKAEKEALEQEIDILKQTSGLCEDKCKYKHDSLMKQMKKIDEDIAVAKQKCIRCNQHTDTLDIGKYCSDCPRCLSGRDCLINGVHCENDPEKQCVCMSTKEKFLDNVLENMYTVLERQAGTNPGKAIADMVMKSLKNSKNGKLNKETRKELQEFVLTTVKKNLNLTIIGGAVKTRCEMEPETYQQLMLCLTQVAIEEREKVDKGTGAKKEPCRRWGSSLECNCPGGTKACICTKRAPPPLKQQSSVSPVQEENAFQGISCPHIKDSSRCGPKYAKHTHASAMGKEMISWQPDPCSSSSCPYSNNMRAAQCVMGPESAHTFKSSAPYVPKISKNSASDSGLYNTNRHGKDAKQLKAGIVKCCDDSCSTYSITVWDEKMNSNHQLCVVEKTKHEEYNCKNEVQNSEQMVKRLPNEPAQIFSKSRKFMTLEGYLINILDKELNCRKNISHEPRIDKVKTNKLAHKETQLSDPGILLSYTSSGNLFMELDEEPIKTIEKKSMENSNIIVTVKKSDSGHILINFNSVENTGDKMFRIKTKQSPSGILFIVVKDDFINMLEENYFSNKIKVQDMSKRVDAIQKNKNNPIQAPLVYKDIKIHKTQNQDKNYNNIEFKQKSKDNSTTTVKIENNSGLFYELEAPIKITKSGTTGVEINKLSLNNAVKRKLNKRAVVIKVSDSSSFIFNNFQKDALPNSIIRKTESGNFLLIVTDSVMNSMDTVKPSPPIQKNHRMKIKTANYDIDHPPTVLMITPSRNYVLIPDKEYEIPYKQTVQKILEGSTEYHLNITRTLSDNYILNLDDLDTKNNRNTLIVKCISGDIKIITKNICRTSTHFRQPNSIAEPSKALDKILEHFQRTSRHLSSSIMVPMSSISPRKSICESNLYEKVKLFYPDHKELLVESSTILKNTSSGHYAIVLDEKSKYTLNDNLRSYLNNNIQGLVPIKKTDTGEITIDMNGDSKKKTYYESVKITPSGKLFVIVDEELAKEMIKKPMNIDIKIPSDTDVTSDHIIEKNQNQVNKSVTTTCNAMPEKNSCDVSKCVCSEITFESVDKKNINNFGLQTCRIDRKKIKYKDGSYNDCDSNVVNYSTESYSVNKNSKTSSTQVKALPHIIIKPCSYETELLNNPHTNEQCFSVIETICTLSADDKTNYPEFQFETYEKCSNNRDSLNFLAPQLPEFLKGFKYQ